MEQYLWMAIGAVIVGLFVKTYWDVYTAYRAFIAAMPVVRTAELLSAPPRRTAGTGRKAVAWLLERGDRFLHAMLMSPLSR